MFNNKGMTKVWPILGIIAIIVIIIILSITLSTPYSDDVIKIGFSGPLSGDVASWGINALAGTQLAINEINSQGGIDGKQIQLIVEDDKGLADQATLTITKLISQDAVDAVIFGSGSGAGGAAIPIIEKNKIPTVIAVASNPLLTTYGDYVFRVYPNDLLQAKFMAKYVEKTYPEKNVAIIYTNETWGQGITNIFKENFNGNIVYEDSTLIESIDLRTQVENAKSKNAEISISPQRPTNGIAMLKAMKELNYNPIIIGGDVYDSDELISSKYAENVMYTVPVIQVTDSLKNKIRAMQDYKDLEISMAASQGYDATKVLLNAMKGAKTNEEIKTNLQKTDFISNNGQRIQFDSQGDLVTGSFEIKIIRNKKSETYYKE
jgi:branched-chain amino acid transport system substrate-binding protein